MALRADGETIDLVNLKEDRDRWIVLVNLKEDRSLDLLHLL